MRSPFALGSSSDRILALWAQGDVMLFDAQQYPARAGLDGRTLGLDISSARFTDRGDLHERSLARLRKNLELRLDTFRKLALRQSSGGAKLVNILAARL
jgi:hypothetical protein